LSSPERFRLIAFCVGALALLGLFAFQVQRGLKLETNILALLPATEKDSVVEEAMAVFTRHVSAKMIFLIGHEDADKAARLAQELTAELEASGWFEDIGGRIEEDAERHFYDLYFPYRWQLLDEAARAALARGDAAYLTRAAERELNSPMSSLYSRILEDDPLLLFPAYMRSMPEPPGDLGVRDGWVGTRRDGVSYIMITAGSRDDAFSRRGQQRAAAFLDRLYDRFAAEDGAELYTTGALRYAAFGAETAEREASTIGTGSILAVLLLFLAVFRSIRPMLLGLLPILFGLLTAAAVCFAVFSRVHLLTLAFGAGLIGVCIDYTFHFFCERWEHDGPEGGGKALRAIFPAITLGVVTSVMGYLGMLAAPFPGLRQMALFSAVGLLGAYATVVCCFPALARFRQGNRSRALSLAANFLGLWQKWKRQKAVVAVVGLALAVFVATGLWSLTPDDDVRRLQDPPAELLSDERFIRDLAGGVDASRFLLIEGATQDETLQRERQVHQRLARLREEGALGYFQGVSAMVPDTASQRDNRALLQKTMLGPEERLAGYMRSLGFADAAIAQSRAALAAPTEDALTVAEWLAHPASRMLRQFWLGATERGFATLTALGGIRDAGAVEALEDAFPNVHYIDKVADYSSLMQRYRRLATALTALSYVAVFLLLVFRYGWLRGAKATLAPVTAALTALAFLGHTGLSLNLFHILALLLVLGIGIDYTIFFAESRTAKPATMLAIMLSGCTTVASFGLLALSRTPFLSSFGLVVMIGIVTALLLSPAAGRFAEADGGGL